MFAGPVPQGGTPGGARCPPPGRFAPRPESGTCACWRGRRKRSWDLNGSCLQKFKLSLLEYSDALVDGLRKAGEGGTVSFQGEPDELVASVVQELVGSRFRSPLIDYQWATQISSVYRTASTEVYTCLLCWQTAWHFLNIVEEYRVTILLDDTHPIQGQVTILVLPVYVVELNGHPVQT